MGIQHDKTLWSRILRGRWNIDSRNIAMANPILAIEKLIDYVDRLREAAREEEMRGRIPFVMTTEAKRIFDYIDLKRARDRVNRFGIIVGATGCQKTATYRAYRLLRNHGSTWWFEAPANGAVGEFLNRLAGCSGLSVQTSSDKKRAHLLESIKAEKCIIVDNCQDLFRPEWGSRQPAFSFLRQLQDETECAMILSITPPFEDMLKDQALAGYFEQFEGRSGGRKNWLRLEAYPPEDDVLAIAKSFGLKDARAALKRLVAVSRQPGRIRRLFEDLQNAKLLANAGGEALSIDHLNEVWGED
jgi:DNA transposition AAA+ family ATPase